MTEHRDQEHLEPKATDRRQTEDGEGDLPRISTEFHGLDTPERVRFYEHDQSVMPDLQTPAYKQALADVALHLEAMLERGTERTGMCVADQTMWPPYFPNPPTPPADPEPPPVQLGRCVICDQLTQRRCSSFGCAKFVCPRSECQRDHEQET